MGNQLNSRLVDLEDLQSSVVPTMQHPAKMTTMGLLMPGTGILERAQRATRTRFGRVIAPATGTLATLRALEAIRNRPTLSPNAKILLSEPLAQLSPITELVGLTGAGGIVKERFDQFARPVGCVINVTYEVPLLKVDGIESYRIPVEDDPKEDLSIYFDEVLEKMHTFELKGQATVVHCLAGVGRSAAIVIAYLIRRHEMSLEQAFRYTKSKRGFINPNVAFLEQLARFESVNRTVEQCTFWCDYTQNERTRRLPAFIIKDFLDDYPSG